MNPPMNRWLIRIVGLVSALFASASHAILYAAPMDSAEWRLKESPFECRLWQPIPVYGDAVFSARAGESAEFYLSPKQNPMRKGKASLKSTAPIWGSSRAEVDFGYVPVVESAKPVTLKTPMTRRLLDELYHGMSPVFTRRAWYNNETSVQVMLSSVNFRKAFDLYQNCLAQLLPVNFEQISRTRLRFASANNSLSAEAKRKLDLIVRYVKVDTTVDAFYIDGYSDSYGRRIKNLELSKHRAEAVTNYLVSMGVDEEKITTRYHGERYPVASNKTAAGRADNRRVTIRLERSL